MQMPPLVSGTLLRRYKRFLADVKLDDGHIVTAHCPNTGSMRGCSDPGRTVYLSRHDSPKRKYPFTWQLIRMPGSLVGVNTMFTNPLVREGIALGAVQEFKGWSVVRSEPRLNSTSRLDFLLEDPCKNRLYLEVKNCTLVRHGTAAFPDAVTSRGQKHLRELMALSNQGIGAAILFLVQREDARTFNAAGDIDPQYASLLSRAVGQGVQVMAYGCRVGTGSIVLDRPLPVAV